MKKTTQLLSFCALASVLASGVRGAPITYVDAVVDSALGTPNTVATDGSAQNLWYEPAGAFSTNDTDWARRSGTSAGNLFGNGVGNDILQGHTSMNNLRELTTTITGLTAGETYEIYVFFWDAATNQAWNIDSGLTSGSLTTYTGPDNASIASTADGYAVNLTFDSAVVTGNGIPEDAASESGNRDMMYAVLGTQVANGSGEIDVFVNNSLSVGSNARRSWYDGVGYALVPEPNSFLLLAVGSIGCLIRRRHV